MYIAEKPKSYVYINFGRVIADCPVECGNAIQLQPGQTTFFCQGGGGCGTMGEIVWPSNIDDLIEVLSDRLPKFQNWFPENHSLALKAGCPHGQTVEELREETAAHKEV